MIRVYCVDALEDACVETLREQILEALKDPDYSMVTNFNVQAVDIPEGAVVIVEEGYKFQVEHVQEELEKVRSDPDYVAVFPYNILVGPVLRLNQNMVYGFDPVEDTSV